MADAFTDALTGGKATVDLRVRYEGVDQTTADGEALTARTRIGYMTGDLNGLTGFIEMSDTSSLSDRQNFKVPFGPDSNPISPKSVILDPSITTLNQSWLAYQLGKTTLKAGRQRIIIDNRFLGNVGWRQKEQIYSGLSINSSDIPNTVLDYAYINNTINPVGVDLPMQTHALKAQFSGLSFAKLTGYAFLIDYDAIAASDSKTLGARLTGKMPLNEDLKLAYHLEYANQEDYADSKNIGGDYTRGELTLDYKASLITLGQEKLGGNGTSSFNTPLATLHLYNGWTDTFLVTPTSGLVDNYINLSGKALGLNLAATYHEFSADINGIRYGSEYDFLASKKFSKIYTAGIKYAAYSKDNFAVDTNKLWIWAEAQF